MRILTAEESRRLDRISQEKYEIPSYSLMSRAGEAIAATLLRRFPNAVGENVLVVCGKGNNGGDGFVAARHLKRRHVDVEVLLVGAVSELKGDAARACEDFQSEGGTVRELREGEELPEFPSEPVLIVDAIFGVGLNAPLQGTAQRVVEWVNSRQVPVIAVDIPTGVSADTGRIMGTAVRAAVTVTFGLAKVGHYTFPGARYCGELEVVDIGFPEAALKDIAPGSLVLERNEVAALLPRRPVEAHKGLFGHQLIIAGSRGKSGAAVLAARGALRAGSGLVTAAVPDCVAEVVAAGCPELMTEPLPSDSGHFAGTAACQRLEALLDGKSAVAFGPGIGVTEAGQQVLQFLLDAAERKGFALVVDADGLNTLARMGPERARRTGLTLVLTPHPGEMARLLSTKTEEVNADRVSAARELAVRTGAFVVHKGARSVIVSPDGRLAINTTGNPGMSTAGMGDVLTGVVAALLGQKLSPMEALSLAVFVHGFAADRLARRRGPMGYLASEVADELPAVFASLEMPSLVNASAVV